MESMASPHSADVHQEFLFGGSGASGSESQVASASGSPSLSKRMTDMVMESGGLSKPKSFGERLHQQAQELNVALHEFVESFFGARCIEASAWLEWIATHVAFEALCTMVILFNTCFLAITTEFHARGTAGPDEEEIFQSLQLFLSAFYSLELMVRIAGFRLQFFFGKGRGWNWFDIFLVVTTVPELLATSTANTNLSYLRIARLLKVLKVLRIVRLMRSFRELRLILGAIMGSAKGLLWSLVFIFTITFMFALCFVQGVTDFLADGRHLSGDIEEEALKALQEDWGSLSSGMVSLFAAATGGLDWKAYSDCFFAVGPHYYGIFIFYIAFFSIVVVNTITALFVDSVREGHKNDDYVIHKEHLSKTEEYVGKITKLYRHLDVDNDGQLTQDEFRACLGDPRMTAFATSLEIDVTDLDLLFDILSGKGKYTVDIETFIIGCIRLKGPAKSIDVVDVAITQRRNTGEQRSFARWSLDRLNRLEGLCSDRQLALQTPERSDGQPKLPAVTPPPTESRGVQTPGLEWISPPTWSPEPDGQLPRQPRGTPL